MVQTRHGAWTNGIQKVSNDLPAPDPAACSDTRMMPHAPVPIG